MLHTDRIESSYKMVKSDSVVPHNHNKTACLPSFGFKTLALVMKDKEKDDIDVHHVRNFMVKAYAAV